MGQKQSEVSAKLSASRRIDAFRYMFVLMDIERHLWSTKALTLDGLLDAYHSSHEKFYCQPPSNKYGFLAESIFLTHPAYMPLYFFAELVSSQFKIESWDRVHLQRKIASIYEYSESKFFEDLDSLVESRAQNLRELVQQ